MAKHPPGRSLTRCQVSQAAKHFGKLDLGPSVSPGPLKFSAILSEALMTKGNASEALPERDEILDRYFISLESSIRLLTSEGSMSTFTRIRSMVENSTGRTFSISILAQLKYIFWEGIEIEKISVHDEHTGCVKPDLHVALNYSIIRNVKRLKSNIKSLRMRNLFRSRLVSSSKALPEGHEVPQALLPEPFGPRIITEYPKSTAFSGSNWFTNKNAEPVDQNGRSLKISEAK